MFDAIACSAGDAISGAYTILIQTLLPAFGNAVSAARQAVTGLGDNLTLLAFVAGPGVAIIGFVWSERGRFARRHGDAAARGWAWTIAVYALGWTVLTHATMQTEVARGAWTSATLTPMFLWPIGIAAMISVTYGTLGLHWFVRRLVEAGRDVP